MLPVIIVLLTLFISQIIDQNIIYYQYQIMPMGQFFRHGFAALNSFNWVDIIFEKRL